MRGEWRGGREEVRGVERGERGRGEESGEGGEREGGRKEVGSRDKSRELPCTDCVYR